MRLLLTITISLLPSLAISADFTGKVVGVIDGDSIRVMHEGKAEQIRLSGIDCPEKHQAFGRKAKEFTSEKIPDPGQKSVMSALHDDQKLSSLHRQRHVRVTLCSKGGRRPLHRREETHRLAAQAKRPPLTQYISP